MNRIAGRLGRWTAALATLALVAACVTVNFYFPAAQVEKAAGEIVDQVYGKQDAPKPAKPADKSALGTFLALLGPRVAHAQDAASVSNAAIRGLKEQIAANHAQLAPFYASGHVGITNQGLLDVRSTDGLALPQVAQLKRLVAADNQARQRLYDEVAAALNVDASQVQKVRAVFAEQWIAKAGPGWWVQGDDGSWRKK